MPLVLAMTWIASAGCSDHDESSTSAAGGGSATTSTNSDTASVTSGSSSLSGGSSSLGGGSSSSSTGAVDGLGAHPVQESPLTLGGTMTFTNVGAAGYWARRLNRDTGDPACNIKDGLDTWGGHCCLARHDTPSTTLSPFDEEMTLLLKTVKVEQLAVYQPSSAEEWSLVSSWDDRTAQAQNFWFTESGSGSATFAGDLTGRDCVWYVNQAPIFDCGDGRDYFCPNDPGILHRGWSGSKLLVLLLDFRVDDANVAACSGEGSGHPGPWIALVASELTRDGARKWDGACNCYSRTGSVGDGCGEINLFEVVLDNNEWSNREFASTGVRSFQSGHVGGSVCGSDCARSDFPAEAEVVDACAKSNYATGPVLAMGGQTDGCPVWQRPEGERYLVVLLDETRRLIEVALLNPKVIPETVAGLLPALPGQLPRNTIDAIAELRLPDGD